MESISPPPYDEHDRFPDMSGSRGSGALGFREGAQEGRRLLRLKTLAQMINRKERIGIHFLMYIMYMGILMS